MQGCSNDFDLHAVLMASVNEIPLLKSIMFRAKACFGFHVFNKPYKLCFVLKTFYWSFTGTGVWPALCTVGQVSHENPWNVSFSVARFDPLPSRFEWMNSSGIIKMMDSVLLCEALSAHMLLRTTKGAVWLRGQKLQQFLACTENHHHKDYSGWHAQESSHKILIIIFLAVFSRPASLQVQHLQPVSSAAIFTPPILYTLRLLLPDLIL